MARRNSSSDRVGPSPIELGAVLTLIIPSGATPRSTRQKGWWVALACSFPRNRFGVTHRDPDARGSHRRLYLLATSGGQASLARNSPDGYLFTSRSPDIGNFE